MKQISFLLFLLVGVSLAADKPKAEIATTPTIIAETKTVTATQPIIEEEEVIVEEEVINELQVYEVPNYAGMKKYMSYKLFSKTSNQYQLQQLATTNQDGLRTVNDRYCVAIGSHFNAKIGQYFDLVLKNGEVLECIMSDQKADCDTDASNIFSNTNSNLCASEFIVNVKSLDKSAKRMGDISFIKEEWKSPVVKIIVYDENVLGDV